MEKNESQKSMEELFKEEKIKLLDEIDEKAKRKKKLMNPDIDNELLK
ncbi:MAG: hypothetical protein ACE5DT_00570 [Nitrosopumilus sp.]